MSFDSKLFGMDDFLPKKRRNGNGRNGKKNGKRNGRSSAKESARGFEAPGFFGGLSGRRGNGIPKADVGVALPELGEGFNSRFGEVGSGFTERVDTFKIGFSDVLTGNGRTGEIIGGGAGIVTPGIGKRKRGRPKGSGKKQRAIGSGVVKSKPLVIATSGARQALREGRPTQVKTVGGLLKEGIRESVRRKPKTFESTSVALGAGMGSLIEREPEKEEVSFRPKAEEENGVSFASPEEGLKNDLEEEEAGLDEDMDDVEENDIDFEVEGGEIKRKPKGGFVG